MQLNDFNNKHKGERVFIIGNGPSLKHTPMDLLQNEYTIATNQISLIYDQTNWRPTYYVNFKHGDTQDYKIEKCMESVELGIPCFMSAKLKDRVPERDNIMHIDSIRINDKQMLEKYSEGQKINKIWSDDITNNVFRSNSVYSMAQIASYMGFEKLYFVGCDGFQTNNPLLIFPEGNNPMEYKSMSVDIFKFIFDGGTPVKSFINGIAVKFLPRDSKMTRYIAKKLGEKDRNHFDENYSTNIRGKESVDKINKKIKITHTAIEKIGQERGFETFDATVNSNIDIHDSVRLNKVLKYGN